MNILAKFSHGLGDAAQFTCVLQHLAKHRPQWTVDVASKIGKHSAFFGQCRRSWILDRESITERDYHQVFDLGWYECYGVYADSPCTKVCNCLREVFGMIPDIPLLKYRIQVGPQAREITGQYLSQISNGHGGPDATGRYPVVAIHYQGNTSPERKNLNHSEVAPLCRELLRQGYTPLILDWDRRSPLPDERTIFCPAVAPDDIWESTGTGDAERLAALIDQCALFVGVDSGPLHVAGATETPTVGVWKAHSPLQFYDLCSNVTHLVPENWRTIAPCQHDLAARFFVEHYDYRTYRQANDLEAELIDSTLCILSARRTIHLESSLDPTPVPSHDIRAPPQAGARERTAHLQDSHDLRTNPHRQVQPTSLPQESLMTTALSLTWELLPGLAHEIALGADGSAWCLGMGEMPDVGQGGGYSLHRWNGSDWDHVEGAAVKLAVAPDGHVWALNRDHHVLRNSSDGWSVLPGLAREIAVGADGSVWCLSSFLTPSGDSTIHVWNGQDWNHVDGAGVKIAVGPDGQPWLLNSLGNVFRRRGEQWDLMPGLAREIAIGVDDSVWCLSSFLTPSADSTIHVWNGSDWDQVPGAGVRITAGAPGAVWLANADHRIFRAV